MKAELFLVLTMMIAQGISAESFDNDTIKFNPLIRDVINERITTHDALMRQIDAILDEQPMEANLDALSEDAAERLPASELPASLRPVANYELAPLDEIRIILIPKVAH